MKHLYSTYPNHSAKGGIPSGTATSGLRDNCSKKDGAYLSAPTFWDDGALSPGGCDFKGPRPGGGPTAGAEAILFCLGLLLRRLKPRSGCLVDDVYVIGAQSRTNQRCVMIETMRRDQSMLRDIHVRRRRRRRRLRRMGHKTAVCSACAVWMASLRPALPPTHRARVVRETSPSRV